MVRDYRINESITEKSVQVVFPDGSIKKDVPISEALLIADSFELDLVEVSEANGDHQSICKILDFGKLRYEQEKKMKQPKSHGVKEIKYNFKTADHDLMIKNKKAKELLFKRHKVRYSVELRGREKDRTQDALDRMKENLHYFTDIAKWDHPQITSGGGKIIVFAVLSPF